MKPIDLLKLIVRAAKQFLALTEKELRRYEKMARREEEEGWEDICK